MGSVDNLSTLFKMKLFVFLLGVLLIASFSVNDVHAEAGVEEADAEATVGGAAKQVSKDDDSSDSDSSESSEEDSSEESDENDNDGLPDSVDPDDDNDGILDEDDPDDDNDGILDVDEDDDDHDDDDDDEDISTMSFSL